MYNYLIYFWIIATFGDFVENNLNVKMAILLIPLIYLNKLQIFLKIFAI